MTHQRPVDILAFTSMSTIKTYAPVAYGSKSFTPHNKKCPFTRKILFSSNRHGEIRSLDLYFGEHQSQLSSWQTANQWQDFFKLKRSHTIIDFIWFCATVYLYHSTPLQVKWTLLSRLQIDPIEKLTLQIREDVPTQPIRLSHQRRRIAIGRTALAAQTVKA